MSLLVVTTPEADDQIKAIAKWWTEHRPAAPALFGEELSECFALLSELPGAGRGVAHRKVKALRRSLLRSYRYHVYDRIEGEAIVVLAVWSAMRGSGPPLGPK